MRQRIDPVHYGTSECGITLVMKVGEMNEAMRGFGAGQCEPPHFEPFSGREDSLRCARRDG
jgi:hypothetical protein